eukprot:m.228467 g.228467  ORF g.228467 m.228467 type:complete len:97 (-) comp13878_c0_seq1:288-578(-)
MSHHFFTIMSVFSIRKTTTASPFRRFLQAEAKYANLSMLCCYYHACVASNLLLYLNVTLHFPVMHMQFDETQVYTEGLASALNSLLYSLDTKGWWG